MSHATIALGEGEMNLVTRRGISALCRDVARALDAGQPIIFEPATEGRFFCGGFDLADLAAGTEPEQRQAFADFLTLGRLVFSAPVPVGVMARGHAVGVGAMLVLAADATVMAPRAKLRFPELHLGLTLFADVVALIRYRGSGALAERLLCRAEALAAPDCLDLGLVRQVADGPLPAASLLASIAPAGDLAAFGRLKRLCREGHLHMPVDQQLDLFMIHWHEARLAGKV